MSLPLLFRYPLFALLGKRAMTAWLADAEELRLQTGQTLLMAGTPGTHAYLLLEGRVRVLRAGDSGKEMPLGVYSAGEVFGEYALLKPHLNTASCRACEPGRALRLPLEPLRRTLPRLPGVGDNLKNWLRLHALVSHLRQGAFLGFLSATSVLPLLDRCHEVCFRALRSIQAQGLSDDRWFFVRDGEVALHSEDEPDAEPILVGPGGCFGERGLLGRGRLATAVAMANTTCLSLHALEFHRPVGVEVSDSQQTFQRLHGRSRRPYEWLAQRGPTDCGVASLAMAARQLGLDVTLERVGMLLPVGERGASLHALREAAVQLGFRVSAVRIGADQVGDVATPAVAHLSDGHYVTLFEVKRDGVVLGDPATGMATLDLPSFQRRWSGHLLLLTPPEAKR